MTSIAEFGRMRLRTTISVVLAIVSVARGSAAQARSPVARGVMDGVVTDSSLTPITGATISLLGSRISATTGEDGRFRIVALPAGEYVVLARRFGFASASATLHLDGGDALRPSFALQRAIAELDTVRASAVANSLRLGEFEERRARKVGHFITADEIYKANPVYVADMLEKVLSVRIVANEIGVRKAYSMRTVGKNCPFQIFVDGMIFSDLGDLSRAPPPSDIAGVEVYSGPATIPLEYKRHDTQCGVILIWTKAGS